MRANRPAVLQRRRSNEARACRWTASKLDPDRLAAAIIAEFWGGYSLEGTDVHEQAAALIIKITRACDVAMPRTRTRLDKRAAYWWTPQIAALRQTVIRTRRRLKRINRLRQPPGNPTIWSDAYAEYRDARRILAMNITWAKARSWDELIEDLDRNPWGRPYHLMMQKLQQGGPRVTEIQDPQFVARIVNSLFPVHGGMMDPIPVVSVGE